MSKQTIRRLKFKTMSSSETPPQAGLIGRDVDTIIAKQVSDTEADLYVCDKNGKILGVKKSPTPTPSPSIFIRQATPIYTSQNENKVIFLTISIESEVPFSIKSIKLVRNSSGNDARFGFIEEILPLKVKEDAFKNHKSILFIVTNERESERGMEFFYSILRSFGVEVTVTVEDADKVLFSYFSITEKFTEAMFDMALWID